MQLVYLYKYHSCMFFFFSSNCCLLSFRYSIYSPYVIPGGVILLCVSLACFAFWLNTAALLTVFFSSLFGSSGLIPNLLACRFGFALLYVNVLSCWNGITFLFLLFFAITAPFQIVRNFCYALHTGFYIRVCICRYA
ncbi:hypothetical protein EUBVEN_00464 [Eubacterium ventriosum ATCC 27560]|uniref:Uncharacterized protein n=1 Tax=Eubacterium ventriosum ATCC 27560 TaxID=411463 RepID=A5Z458_9FIRM|nr:hypothetical protein EUBVEN_00464 [Eubacterium ventriosum ATCC 27560]